MRSVINQNTGNNYDQNSKTSKEAEEGFCTTIANGRIRHFYGVGQILHTGEEMMKLTEIKEYFEDSEQVQFHYFMDENSHITGCSKEYYACGAKFVHTFFLDGELHGEYFRWCRCGDVIEHSFYKDGIDITDAYLKCDEVMLKLKGFEELKLTGEV